MSRDHTSVIIVYAGQPRPTANVTPAGSLQWFGLYKLLRAGSGLHQELVEDLWSYQLQEDAEFALGADAGLLAGDEPRLAGAMFGFFVTQCRIVR